MRHGFHSLDSGVYLILPADFSLDAETSLPTLGLDFDFLKCGAQQVVSYAKLFQTFVKVFQSPT